MKRRPVLEGLLRFVSRRHGMPKLIELGTADLDDLRVLTELFAVVDRRPVARPALDHVVENVDGHFSGRELTTLTATVLAALHQEMYASYQQVGRDDDAQHALLRAERVRPLSHDLSTLALLHAIRQTEPHMVPPLVPAAVIRALITEAPRLREVCGPAKSLVATAQAARLHIEYPLLELALERLRPIANSPGLHAAVGFFDSTLAEWSGDRSRSEDLLIMAARRSREMTRDDPAREVVQWLLSMERHRLPRVGPGEDVPMVLGDAVADAERRGDPAAIELYEQLLRSDPLPPSHRGVLRILAEQCRLRHGELANAEAFTASIDRLVADDFARARDTPFQVGDSLYRMLEQAVGLCPGPTHLVSVVQDLMAESCAGAAVGALDTGGVAIPALALVDRLSSGVERVRVAAVCSAFPDRTIAWVSCFPDADAGAHLLVTELMPGRSTPTINSTVLDPGDLTVLKEASGMSSELIGDDDIRRLSDLIFSPTPSGGGDRADLLLVPDPYAWNMPWNRLVPHTTRSVTVVPSIASASRIDSRPARPRRERPRVAGVLDTDGLAGARVERDALLELHTESLIDFHQVESVAELSRLLVDEEFDALTIAVHGTSGDGLEYQMLFPESASSPARLMTLPLPPIVVLACCWSNRSGTNRNAIAATLSCLAAGADVAVGGAWEIDDETAGLLMAATYRRHFRGLPFTTALRDAYLSLPLDQRHRASGLAVVGYERNTAGQ